MNTPDTALQGLNTMITGWLYMAFELGEKSWKLSLGDAACVGSSRHTPVAGDLNAVLLLAKAKAHCCLAPQAGAQLLRSRPRWLLAAPMAHEARYPKPINLAVQAKPAGH